MANQEIISVLYALQVSRYTSVSAMFLFFYDLALTFGEEIRLIWGTGRFLSLGKLLFIVIRYYALVTGVIALRVIFGTHFSERICTVWFQWQAVTLLILFVTTDAVLQLRIYAMYGRSKKILALTLSTFILCVCAQIGLISLLFIKGIEIPLSLPGASVCAVFSSWTVYWAVWVPPIVFETLLFSLALYKGYCSFMEQRKHGLSSFGLLEILVRDSIAYFFMVFITYLMILLIWLLDFTFIEAPAPFAMAIPTVMSTRLLLNVRSKYYLSSSDPTTRKGPSIGELFDGHRPPTSDSVELEQCDD